MATPVSGASFVKNAGQTTEQVVSQVSTAFKAFRLLGNAGVADLIRNYNQLCDQIERATMPARSLPFGGPLTYVLAYSFTNGSVVSIPHRLNTTSVRVWLGAPTAVSAGSPYATWALNAKNPGLIDFTPAGTFTADVLFLVSP